MGPHTSPLWLTAAQAVPIVLAYGWFAVSSVALVRIDVHCHRLPNATVLPGYVVALGCFGTSALLGGPPARLLSALVGMLALLLFYLVLRAISRRGMGGGDVKLAGVIGLHLGWLGITPLLLGAVLAFLLGGAYATVLLLRRRATGTTRIPFGPFMLAGAWIAVIVGFVDSPAGIG